MMDMLRRLLFAALASVTMTAHASAALLLEEPFGTFGYLNPTGHAAVYLSDVCAETPVHLRRCRPGEAGVVISRYHRVGGYDWLAIPLVPYLYAVNEPDEIPSTANAAVVAELRDVYRRKHLLQLAPDNADGSTPSGEWVQLIGSLYDRRIYVYEVDTSPENYDALIAELNARPNHSHFNLLFRNCADLARNIIDFYYPHSIHRNINVDVGLTTPKQAARSLEAYARRHEDINLRVYVLPQIEGRISRSRHVDGVIESFLKTKYVLPVAVFEPAIAAGLAGDYLARGRFDPDRGASVLKDASDLRKLYQPDDAAGPAAALAAQQPVNALVEPAGFLTGPTQPGR